MPLGVDVIIILDILEDEIKNATQRQVGQIAVKTEGMSDEERLRIMREEKESDRSGTYPGTSRELTPDEREAGKRLERQRLKEIKKQEKIDKAINIVSRINPNTRDSSLARELSIARAYLLKNNLNPDDYFPDHWKNN